MAELTILFGATLLVVMLMTSISIWAPRRVTVRAGALAAALLFVPLSYASLASLLARPKPVSLEWLRGATAEAQVLGSSLQEGVAIFVWLQLPDSPEPLAYRLPWNLETAKQLQKAQREAEAKGTGLAMRLPFEPSLETREPKFYPLPQPALPPKQPPGDGPTHFAHPSTET